ncbi:transposase [Streptomyces sp. Ru72]|uniref:transposase n=1 Tax=Streptomyces sp. Ru72 TaxID=2080747 RepID=UPI0015E3AE75|nr:transposase [Streptomyces sp. Ru72]
MQSSHVVGVVCAAFDEPNLIAHAGLVPVVRLAERLGLPGLVGEAVRIEGAGNSGGAKPAAKVMSLLAAMCAGADSIDDADRLRHGSMPLAFAGVRAPSTLGTFLRSFTHGHVLQLHAVHRKFLRELAAHTPLLPGAGQLTFIDIDSTHKRVFGRAKQGAQIGRFKGVRTLHPLLATLCTPTARPVIAAVRLRQGKSADSRGAPRFVTEALATAVEAGCSGIRILRAYRGVSHIGVFEGESRPPPNSRWKTARCHRWRPSPLAASVRAWSSATPGDEYATPFQTSQPVASFRPTSLSLKTAPGRGVASRTSRGSLPDADLSTSEKRAFGRLAASLSWATSNSRATSEGRVGLGSRRSTGNYRTTRLGLLHSRA